jgi:uncharacterized NAD(P)/FAD-binding protein YdhS
MHRPVVAIVGAGFSGVMTALSVLEVPRTRARVLLFEQASQFGLGAAFGPSASDHTLNVRAMNMSVDPARPDDFADWLGRRHDRPTEHFAFASRAEYGAYIQQHLRRVAQTRAGADRLDLVADQVVAVRPAGDGFELDLALGRTLQADVVVLAVGNAPPSQGVLPDPAFASQPHYVGDPWAPGALDRVAPDDPILLLGSGLTMVDVIASLDAKGHRGSLLALSRRGLLPQRHAPVTPAKASWRRESDEPLSAGVRRFRRQAAEVADWRILFDAVRANTQDHWKGLSLVERRRFLRHLRPWWDIHRHRLSPAMAARLDGWRATRLQVAAGKLEALTCGGETITAAWRPRGANGCERRAVSHVINCTGPEGDPRQSRSPLIRQMLASGLAQADALGLGLDTTEAGGLIGANGPHPRLFALGPAARGALWEVTAAPDIRVQARRLGAVLGSTTAAWARRPA